MRILFIFFCTLWYVSAKPNTCCLDDAVLVDHLCPNKNDTWLKHCPQQEAFGLPSEDFKINYTDDSLHLLYEPYTRITSDSYCLGTDETGNKLALICHDDDSPEMSKLGSLICLTITIICLALTLIVYILLPNLRDLQGKCLMFTIFSLLMAFFVLFMITHVISEVSELGCEALASLLYFTFMCACFWLNVVSFNVWRSIVRPNLLSNKNQLFLLYNAYAWGGAVLFLIIVLICHKVPGNHIKPKFGETSCWFSESAGLRAYFYGPITVLILSNIIMFMSTAWTLAKQNNRLADRRRRSHLFKFGLYLKLFVIMGICWIFEPLSELFFDRNFYVWIITDYINSLQGLIIFLLLVVFRRRVRRDLARRSGVCCRTLPQEWATIPDEDIDELEEDVDEHESLNDNNIVLNRTL